MRGLAGPLVTGFWRRMVLGYRDVLAEPDAAYQRSVQLVQVTYAVWTYVAVSAVRSAPGWIDRGPPSDLLWPSAWMTALPWAAAVVGVVGVFLVGNLVATLVPRSTLARVVALAGILAAQGLKYSYDKINHSYHLWVLAALLLVFLPRGDEDDPRYRRSYLEIAWGVQATILATYTLAGLQKLWGAAEDLLEDGHTVFSLDSLALHVAKAQLRGTEDGVLAPFAIDHPTLSGLLMVGALALELLALTVVFRRRAQRWFAVGFIALHVGVGLVMQVWFEAQVLVVAVWLVGTPFVVGRASAFATIHELPWVGPALALPIARRAGQDRLTVYRDPARAGDVAVPANADTADIGELGLPHVSYAVRHEVRGSSVVMVGRRAHLWAEQYAGGRGGSALRLLLPAVALPAVPGEARADPHDA